MLYTHIAAAVMGLAIGLTGAWQVQEGRYARKELVRVEAENEAKRFREKTMYSASSSFESDRTKIRTQYIHDVVTVTEIIERPVYLNTCIDEDGLKVINGVKP